MTRQRSNSMHDSYKDEMESLQDQDGKLELYNLVDNVFNFLNYIESMNLCQSVHDN